ITPKTPLDGELPSSTFAAHHLIRHSFGGNLQCLVECNNCYWPLLKFDPVGVTLKNVNIVGIFVPAPLYNVANNGWYR
ncbi:hypothetical protein ACSFS4_005114, partial [Escherichia coli]